MNLERHKPSSSVHLTVQSARNKVQATRHVEQHILAGIAPVAIRVNQITGDKLPVGNRYRERTHERAHAHFRTDKALFLSSYKQLRKCELLQ